MTVLFIALWCFAMINCAISAEELDTNAENYIVNDDDDNEVPKEYDATAILGSKALMKEFRQLPEDVAKEKLKALIIKMDINRDLLIERKEMKEWIKNALRSVADEKTKQTFLLMDKDNSKCVTWDEYYNETVKQNDKTHPERRVETGTIRFENGQNRVLFTAADTDENMCLDENEHFRFSNPQYYDVALLSAKLDYVLEFKDMNGDMVLDLSEYLRCTYHDEIPVHQRQFKGKDENEDGVLNRSELSKAVVADVDETASSHVADFFWESDYNEDNVLTYDEILQTHYAYIGGDVPKVEWPNDNDEGWLGEEEERNTLEDEPEGNESGELSSKFESRELSDEDVNEEHRIEL